MLALDFESTPSVNTSTLVHHYQSFRESWDGDINNEGKYINK